MKKLVLILSVLLLSFGAAAQDRFVSINLSNGTSVAGRIDGESDVFIRIVTGTGNSRICYKRDIVSISDYNPGLNLLVEDAVSRSFSIENFDFGGGLYLSTAERGVYLNALCNLGWNSCVGVSVMLANVSGASIDQIVDYNTGDTLYSNEYNSNTAVIMPMIQLRHYFKIGKISPYVGLGLGISYSDSSIKRSEVYYIDQNETSLNEMINYLTGNPFTSYSYEDEDYRYEAYELLRSSVEVGLPIAVSKRCSIDIAASLHIQRGSAWGNSMSSSNGYYTNDYWIFLPGISVGVRF